MRRLAVLMTMMVVAQGAQAADLPDFLGAPLRGGFQDGPAPHADWRGFYVGGQAGAGFSNMNFTGAADSLISQLLANTTIQNEFQVSQWPLMGKVSASGQGYGGFFGYNAQWDEAVLSLEASYLHGEFGGSTSGSMSRLFTTSDGYSNSVTSSATAKVDVHDMMTFRARGGYAWGNLLPYMFAGVSLGFADVVRSATVTASGTYIGTNVPPPPNYGPVTLNAVDQKNNQFIYGYSAGFGADYMLFSNLFLRGEYEYLRFTASTDVSINTIRGGIGLKF